MGEITPIFTDSSDAIANSFWETKDDAETHNNAGYPYVLKALSKVVEGPPPVGSAMVANSTFRKIAAQVASSKYSFQI